MENKQQTDHIGEPNKKVTAIDWFIDNLPERFKNAILNTCKEEIEQARAMYKEQIIEAAERWKETDFAEQYYRETYGE